MNKKILTLAAFFLGVMYADADNISVADVTIEPGQTASVGISLNNTETNLVSFQMDLTLPEGITVNKAGCSLSSRFTDGDQELTIGKQGDNVYRLTSTSFALTPISGNSGEIITLSLTASSTSAGGSATISNIRFVTSNSEKVTMDNTTFKVISPDIVFVDSNVKAICVQNWDTDGDGELSEAEAAAVTSLGANVFKDNTDITSFDELQYFTGLTSIEQSAFSGCSNLRSVSLPEGLQSIKNNAFANSGLESIRFPSTLTAVGNNAFVDCKQLASIDFNGCSATFDYECFRNCTSLEEVIAPSTVTFTGWSNFYDCKSLKNVVLASTSSLQLASFQFCTNLESVTFLTVDNILNKNYSNVFGGVPREKYTLFNIPEGNAEQFLQAGYANLSDLGGLPIVRAEFEAEAERIMTMAGSLTGADLTSLNAVITEARSISNGAENYITVYNQIAAIKSAAKSFLANATLTKDFDVTAAFITNPDLERFDIGWYVFPWHGKRGWSENRYENADVAIDKFVEARIDDGTLSSGNISQTITKLNAGIYRLEADIIATNQNDASTTAMGVYFFAGNLSIPVATENLKPRRFSLKFENPVTQSVKIGISVNATNANWVALDNVRLYYEGAAAVQPQGIDLVSDENARVYLYNVETGKYLSSGHSYGTHALLDETGLPIRLTQDEETGLWQIYFWDSGHNEQLLFSGSGGGTYVDYSSVQHGSAGNPWWSFTQAADGSYFIHNSALGEDCYLGNDPTRQDSQAGDYSGVSFTDVNANVSADKNVRWLILTKESSDLQAAKRRLMSTILRMEGSEQPNEDLLATAQMVYDDGDATLDEVIGIITTLNSQMGMPKDNQPVDMTALITNPRFENNTTEGWSGANVVGGRVDATSNNEQEFWQTNFNMYQTIMGVPNGRYLVKWKGFHSPGNFEDNYNAYSEGTDNASAVVYANGVQKTMKNHASDGSSQCLFRCRSLCRPVGSGRHGQRPHHWCEKHRGDGDSPLGCLQRLRTVHSGKCRPDEQQVYDWRHYLSAWRQCSSSNRIE